MIKTDAFNEMEIEEGDSMLPEPANEVSKGFREYCEKCDEYSRRLQYEYSRAYLNEKYGYDVIDDYDTYKMYGK